MEANEHKAQLLLTLKELDFNLTDADTKKLLSNLVYNTQLYCWKGGIEDLW